MSNYFGDTCARYGIPHLEVSTATGLTMTLANDLCDTRSGIVNREAVRAHWTSEMLTLLCLRYSIQDCKHSCEGIGSGSGHVAESRVIFFWLP